MLLLAAAQVLALVALAVFWVLRGTQSNPFDRLMAVTASQGGLVAADLLGPGPVAAGRELCLSGHAPKGTTCSRAASRAALAAHLEAMQSAGCRSTGQDAQLDGSVEITVGCQGRSLTVAFVPAAGGLHGRPEPVWPGFAGQGFAKGESGVWSFREQTGSQ